MTSRIKRQVIKRNGTLEPVSFDKITTRLVDLCDMEPCLDQGIDPQDITRSIIDSIADRITTVDIDNYMAKYCGSKLDHPDYLKLAARLVVSSHQKNLLKQNKNGLHFSYSMTKLYNNVNQINKHSPLIYKEFYEYIDNNKDTLDSMLVNDRDYIIDYFGINTLLNSYLKKIYDPITKKQILVENPQHLYMRIAVSLHLFEKDTAFGLKKIKESYDLLSQHYFTHATPTMFNAGTKQSQLSCFLMPFGPLDSIESNFKSVSDAAKISQGSGGIGGPLHEVRANGAYIGGSGGTSSGIIPYMQVINATAKYVNQGGKRNGSIALYLEPWHADIFDFIDAKTIHGPMERKARDLFYALWIPDLFMTAVKNREPWYLMCPSVCRGLSDVHGQEFDDLYNKYIQDDNVPKTKINAIELWDKIISCQIETGMPYMMYKDSVNRKSNQANLGTIKSSNLCVAPETRILTKEYGYKPISELKDQEVNVWNGFEWSKTTVKQTGFNQKLLKVTCSNGTELFCTEYHRFSIKNNKDGDTDNQIVEAKNLKSGSILTSHKLPLNGLLNTDFLKKYEENDKIKEIVSQCKSQHISNDNYSSIILQNTDFKLLFDVKLMFQSIGGSSIITKDHNTNVYKLDIITKHIEEKVLISSVSDPNRVDDTYCFTEPLRNMGMFEGILTMNCSEITEYCSHDKYACCCLASVVLSKYVILHEEFDQIPIITTKRSIEKKNGNIIDSDGDRDKDKDLNSVSSTKLHIRGYFDHKKLASVVKVIVRNLDNIIDNNKYPVPEAKASNMSERPLGIGVQGLADVFYAIGLPYDSDEARELNRNIFETIYYAAISASIELAAERGSYLSYEGSPASKGLLQFDLWNEIQDKGFKKVTDANWNWTQLKKDLALHGLRNSLLTACMPTASTAQICGSTEAFEPMTDNFYTRKVLAGEFTTFNKYLMKDLSKLPNFLKIIKKLKDKRGSVQSIRDIPKWMKDLYKTSFEIKQSVLLTLSADRGPFIDQSQSLNLFVENVKGAMPMHQLVSLLHMRGHSIGLKTGLYYLRTKAGANAENITAEGDDNDNDNIEHYNTVHNSIVSTVSVPSTNVQDNACDMCSA